MEPVFASTRTVLGIAADRELLHGAYRLADLVREWILVGRPQAAAYVAAA